MTTRNQLIADHVRALLHLLGVEADDPLLNSTPEKVASFYQEHFFSGLDPQKRPEFKPFLEPVCQSHEIAFENIPFVSLCEHHLVPMMGKASIRVRPKDYLLGFSKIYELVRYLAAKPQLQERLTEEIADHVIEILRTENVSVNIQATHFCVITKHPGDMTSSISTRVDRGSYCPLATSNFKT